MKPQLPFHLEAELSKDVLRIVYMFVPHFKKYKKVKNMCSVSPNMERDLRLIQRSHLIGKSDMYMRDLDDFVL